MLTLQNYRINLDTACLYCKGVHGSHCGEENVTAYGKSQIKSKVEKRNSISAIKDTH